MLQILNWDILCGYSNFFALCDLIYDCNLYHLVNNPNHIQEKILDLIIVNSKEFVNNQSVLPPNQSPILIDPCDYISITTLSEHYYQIKVKFCVRFLKG